MLIQLARQVSERTEEEGEGMPLMGWRKINNASRSLVKQFLKLGQPLYFATNQQIGYHLVQTSHWFAVIEVPQATGLRRDLAVAVRHYSG